MSNWKIGKAQIFQVFIKEKHSFQDVIGYPVKFDFIPQHDFFLHDEDCMWVVSERVSGAWVERDITPRNALFLARNRLKRGKDKIGMGIKKALEYQKGDKHGKTKT